MIGKTEGEVRCPFPRGLAFRFQGSGCRVQGAEFTVQGAGSRVQGSGLIGSRVQGPGSSATLKGLYMVGKSEGGVIMA